MNRRTFLRAAAAASLAVPLSTCTQQPGKVYRMGVLVPAGDFWAFSPDRRALINALRELGRIEGRNFCGRMR